MYHRSDTITVHNSPKQGFSEIPHVYSSNKINENLIWDSIGVLNNLLQHDNEMPHRAYGRCPIGASGIKLGQFHPEQFTSEQKCPLNSEA